MPRSALLLVVLCGPGCGPSTADTDTTDTAVRAETGDTQPALELWDAVEVTEITETSATFGGSLLSLPVEPVTAYGFCLDTSDDPAADPDHCTSLGQATATGPFTLTVETLQGGTAYYVVAFATVGGETVHTSYVRFETETGDGCPERMVRVEDFCIDRAEAPNQPGVPPLAMQNALEGEAWCTGAGKRLCSEAEWVRTCRGERDQDYPYGNTYQRSTCVDDKTWISPDWTALGTWPSQAAQDEAARLYQAEPSESRAGCVSEEGAYDLTGNVAEWVRRSFPHTNNYDHVMKGCYWAGCFGGAGPSCGFTNPAHPSGFRSYEAGFRCCADAG